MERRESKRNRKGVFDKILSRTSTRNGVGVILDVEMKKNVVAVKRKINRIISVKLVCGEKVLNVIIAYTPQVECEEREKEEFWREMDEETMDTRNARNEDDVIGGDMN